MFQKLHRVVSAANQYLLFVVAILLLITFVDWLLEKIPEPDYPVSKVEIAGNDDQEAQAEQTVLMTSFSEKFNEVYVFRVLSTRINVLEEFHARASVKGMASPPCNEDLGPSLVNFLFIHEDKPG